MIHGMEDCLDKLKAIKQVAQKGIQECNDQTERHKFEQISMEVSYLINEASIDEISKEDS